MFDPYRKWLAIAPKDQPANYYRLLGVDAFEEDLDVIDAAADKQMGFVRQYQSGEHAADAARILNELATARLCLLKPASKAAYDAKLRKELSQAEPEPESAFSDLAFSEGESEPALRRRKKSAAKSKSARGTQQLAVAGGSAAVVCILVVFLFNKRPNQTMETRSQSTTPTAHQVSSVPLKPADEPKPIVTTQTPLPSQVAKQVPPTIDTPFDAAQARKVQEAWAGYLGLDVETTNSINMKLRVIPPGRFAMRPDRRVTISKPFQIAAHETTISQFGAFVNETRYRTSAEKSEKGMVQRVDGVRPAAGKEFTWQHQDVAGGDDYPVGQLSWDDAVEFCRWLGRKEGKQYRLPTEAEWEWACRAGSVTEYYFEIEKESLDDYAWYAANSGGRSHPVGQKKPNAWGLYDMSGNIAEFCQDWFSPLEAGNFVDPTGPATGTIRTIRSYGFFNNTLKISQRGFYPPGGSMNHFGFRVVCDVEGRD
jgi:formylglycine-generating enzyme required for sulfatase activity